MMQETIEISSSSSETSSSLSEEDWHDARGLPDKRARHTGESSSSNDDTDARQPMKRSRTRGPAAAVHARGVKRATGGAAIQSDPDTSAASIRAKKPKKRVKHAHVQEPELHRDPGPSTRTVRVPESGKRRKGIVEPELENQPVVQIMDEGVDDQPIPVNPRLSKLRTSKKSKKDKPRRSSSSFNFTPSLPGFGTAQPTGSTNNDALDSILDQINDLRTFGNTHYRSSRYHEALACYSDALSRYPPTSTPGVSPPLALLTNRAAAYMSLGQYGNALKDMQTALGYPSTDTEGNVKRLSRLLRCYLALGRLEGQEIDDALLHSENQLVLLEHAMTRAVIGSNLDIQEKALKDGRRALADLRGAKDTLTSVHTAREKADWQTALNGLEKLISLLPTSSTAPQEWQMMRGEALAMLIRLPESHAVLQSFVNLPDSLLLSEDDLASRPVEQVTNAFLDWTNEPRRDPAELWIAGIFGYARGDLGKAIMALDALRLHTELPSQASRLFHKAYSVNNLLEQAKFYMNTGKQNKAITSLNEVLRLASEKHAVNTGVRLQAILQRSQAHFQAGNMEEAYSDARRITYLEYTTPRQKFTAFHLGYKVLQHHMLNLDGQPSRPKVMEAVYNLQEALKLVNNGYKVADDATTQAVRQDHRRMVRLMQEQNAKAERAKAEAAAAEAARIEAVRAQEAEAQAEAASRAARKRAAEPAESHRASGSGSGTRTRKSLSDERRWRPTASYHEVLGVSTAATQAEIRTAYKKESLRVHPDKPGGNAEKFKRLSEAYTSLMERFNTVNSGSVGGRGRYGGASGSGTHRQTNDPYARYRRG